MQRQQTEEQRLLRDELHRQSEINVALEAKIAAKSGTSDPDGAAKNAEQLLKRRRKLAYVPEASVNPFPPRPATLSSRMPQLYDLHGNKMYDALSKKSNSSIKYECLVLAPALLYVHDVVCECNDTLDSAEVGDVSYQEFQKRFHAVSNSVHGVYAMLCNRGTMLELRGQLEQEPGSSQRGGADALRAKLQFVEDRVYQAADGVVADEVLQQWLNDFDKNRGKAALSTTAKNAANADSRGTRDHQDQHWRERKKYDEDKDAGASSEQQVWLNAEKERLLGNGLLRNETKDQWDPVQVVEHLGLEVDLKLGQFRVTERQVHKIHVKAKEILCEKPKVDSGAETGSLHGPLPVGVPGGAGSEALLEGALLRAGGEEQLGSKGLPVSYFASHLKGSSATSTTPKVTVGTRLEGFWEDDDEFYLGVMKSFNEDGTAHVVYDDGDEETLNLSKETFKIIDGADVSELADEAADTDGENNDCGGNYEENKRGGAVENFLTRSLCTTGGAERRNRDPADMAASGTRTTRAQCSTEIVTAV
ncbi:hypothetical protein CYMTET_39741 [Cymbomonas tetramitiformis]|uniref:Tudor domain-containing protein n=1 Tax=Cymbomonas tetramitiformis TaxID=36881 RepID=A0AAE0C9J5_9CHLO|nr:hypothetical protein CYMTET_39741 [Cymbomonas tetramitiformis]